METGTKVIIRSKDSGVHFGTIDCVEGRKVRLLDARRIWYWDGAATLSELSQKGPSKPANCKFPAAVPLIEVFDVCEIIPCSAEAIRAIEEVSPWTKH